jgi:DNA-directed RNA polymerase alpha subunit
MKAFPNPNNTMQEGMDLRDWFAGMAMQGIIMEGGLNSTYCNQVSKMAYQFADAMITNKEAKPKLPRLEDLNLTERIKNVLKMANIHTVEDLLKQQRFLYKEPNMGRVSLIHLKIELLKYGIESDFTPAPKQMELL